MSEAANSSPSPAAQSQPAAPLAVTSRSARPNRAPPTAAKPAGAASSGRDAFNSVPTGKLTEEQYLKLPLSERMEYQKQAAAASQGSDQPRQADDRQAPGPKIKIGTDEFDEATVRDALLLHADDAARRANIPAEPTGYKLELPSDLVLPDGVEFEFDPDSPVTRAAQEFAHRKGFDQATYSEMVGLYAGEQAREVVAINAAREAEVQKLGPTGGARVDAVGLWLNGMLGPERGGAILDRLVLADDIAAMEVLQRQFTSQGAGSFSQGGREGRPQGVSEEAYNAMSLPERRQMQLNAQPQNGRRR